MTDRGSVLRLSRQHWLVIGLVGLALALRLGLAVAQGLGTAPEPGTDSNEYDTYAWNVAQGRGYRGMSPDVADQDHLTAFRPPGPSVVWAGVYAVVGHRYSAIRVLHCLAGALTVYLVYLIGLRCFNGPTAVLAAAGYTVWPGAIFFSTTLLSEPLGTFSFLWFILLLLRFGERPTWERALAAGVMLGLTMLTRPNPMFLIPLLFVWAWWQFRGNRAAMVRGLAVPVIALATMSPWWVRNYVVFHRFIPISTMGGSSLLQGNNRIVATDPDLYGSSIWDTKIPEYRDALRAPNDEVKRDDTAKRLALGWISSHKTLLPGMLLNKLVRGWTPFLRPHTPRLYRWGTLVSWGPVLVLFLIGFVPTWVVLMRAGNPGWVLHLTILASLPLTLILFGELRYRHSLEPLCILMAAAVVTGAGFSVRRVRGGEADVGGSGSEGIAKATASAVGAAAAVAPATGGACPEVRS